MTFRFRGTRLGVADTYLDEFALVATCRETALSVVDTGLSALEDILGTHAPQDKIFLLADRAVCCLREVVTMRLVGRRPTEKTGQAGAGC